MKKVKVLRIIARLNIGGSAVHTILLSAGLNKDRFQTLLVTGKVSLDEGDMVYFACKKNVVPLIIPELGRKINFRKDWVAFWKLYRIIKKDGPDIVHTHTAKAGALGRMAALLANFTGSTKKIKILHTFHGHILDGYFNKTKTRIFIWIERLMACFTEKILVVSERIRGDILKLGIGNPDKVIVVPLGLELGDLLSIDGRGHGNSEFNIGIIGRLVPIKNHRMFLDAAKNIKDCSSKDKIKINFLIIGDGELRKELEGYAVALGIYNEVRFLGWQNDLRRAYEDLDIVVITSFNEGTPVSLIEAMAAGRPVVATDVGGVRDLIGNNERGMLVASGDTQAFSSAILQLLADEPLREKITDAARIFVKNKFTKERLINDIEMLYNNILNNRA